ncbi:hypothetical protein H920_08522 [Fukomys damarensis]|uniref:Uncharacterized protein n=1 Tax=Fukomys damarensis TaxID=885580 RepID=A0A091DD48_FUKDA|nr:hypothetical protein H920_08522 [Fukomys damarensis]
MKDLATQGHAHEPPCTADPAPPWAVLPEAPQFDSLRQVSGAVDNQQPKQQLRLQLAWIQHVTIFRGEPSRWLAVNFF